MQNKPLFYVAVISRGSRPVFIKEGMRSYSAALKLFAKTAAQIAALAANIFDTSKVVLMRDGKKVKAVNIDTQFYA